MQVLPVSNRQKTSGPEILHKKLLQGHWGNQSNYANVMHTVSSVLLIIYDQNNSKWGKIKWISTKYDLKNNIGV